MFTNHQQTVNVNCSLIISLYDSTLQQILSSGQNDLIFVLNK